MSVEEILVRSWAEFSALSERVRRILRVDSGGLPEQVFAPEFGHYRFVEFDVMFFPEFWEVLASCASECGDAEISMLLHEPDPEAYYYSKFHRYGALRFDRTGSRELYYRVLRDEPDQSPADALLYIARIVSFCGSSMDWAFWGERDLGVGVAATRKTQIRWPSVEGIRWLTADEALSTIMSPNFRGGVVPENFVSKFRQNYIEHWR